METMLFMGALGAIVVVLYKSVFGAPKQAPVEEITKAEPKRKKPKAAAKPKADKKASAKPKSATKKASASDKGAEVASHKLKNPETGEVVNVPGSYRFVKRWIKDALVSEGLLDKVYKNNELDDASNKKIKKAIDKLKAIKKYQP